LANICTEYEEACATAENETIIEVADPAIELKVGTLGVGRVAAATTKENEFDVADVEFESVYVTATGKVPPRTGVPEITPVSETRLKPVGSEPAVMAYVPLPVPFPVERFKVKTDPTEVFNPVLGSAIDT
jgi:hypothetical protein